ncbi:bifunctional YncE family protein/alkaline phosphatase family protein [Candidatus Methylocalor cossyra]|uniref:bifunctional YncE family protein/alkaline phosphatase family protein n=1 Tax=Candidatus Methylocalor cossyra TaxID=3108543 RepID=UPI0032B20386
MLILTSGYNRNNGPNGARVPAESNEYVFVFDISGPNPVQKQALQVPNTFNGLAWNPKGTEFYVSGGVDDNVHVYVNQGGGWSEAAPPIALGHSVNGVPTGVGINVRPMAAGLAVNASGTQLLVANYFNDSVSLVDLTRRAKVAELDLRPGKHGAAPGTPGGTYPIAAAFKGDDTAYVSSQRDRELVVVNVNGTQLAIRTRIKTAGQPNKMTLNKAQDRLYVASDNSDTVLVVDTTQDRIREEILTTAPREIFPRAHQFKGANPNNVALSPDESTLFVTNGGTNSVAVIRLGAARPGFPDRASRLIGLIPTGWYPNAVSVKPDGSTLYVVNGKGNAGPNPQGCRNTTSIAPGAQNACRAANQYVWQLEKAGFLTLPVPDGRDLARLTWQVAENNDFPITQNPAQWKATMALLRQRIKHVIYVVKENRTYDQVHGDLPKGNGDPSLAVLSPYSPNHTQLASRFVTLDNFYDSGETSGVGWNWSTAGRTTDQVEKTQPPNYAGRGLSYDWEGANRNFPVSFTPEQRQAAGFTDPDVLAGNADVAAPDSREGEAGAGYLWDAALKAGLTLRNYGFFVTNLPGAPVVETPYPSTPQAVALKQALAPHTDPYFRGFDMNNADFYLFKEWEREFDGYAANGNLPNLSLVRLPHDHFGSFSSARFGVNTVPRQMADNDYAVGRLIEKVAKSRYKDDTLIFILEDDAQDGPDHVDAHRSIAYVVGPYVKQGALVSTRYTTVSLLRTIEEVLGLPPLGINDGLTAPMADVFDLTQRTWDYQAVVPGELCATALVENGQPLCAAAAPRAIAAANRCPGVPDRDARYWAVTMEGQDFSVEDRLDEEAFNRALWRGLKGADVPYPEIRHGRDLREGREALLKARAQAVCAQHRLATAE